MIIPAPRWARIAAHVAALTPLPSALWRLALVCGLPAGYTTTGIREIGVDGAGRWYLIALSLGTELAALLTLTLVGSGPARVPGRVLPRALVVRTAATGSLLLTVLWTPNVLWWVIDHPDMTPTGATLVGLVYLPLIAWGPLLAAATWSYARRTRPSVQWPAPVRVGGDGRPLEAVRATRPG